MELFISTHKGVVYKDSIDHLIVKNDEGEFAILKGHIPVISVIPDGFVKVCKDNKEEYFILVNALLEFSNEVANILAHEAINGETKEDALNKLNELRKSRIEKNKKASADYTKLENDLKKNIKESKAGSI